MEIGILIGEREKCIMSREAANFCCCIRTRVSDPGVIGAAVLVRKLAKSRICHSKQCLYDDLLGAGTQYIFIDGNENHIPKETPICPDAEQIEENPPLIVGRNANANSVTCIYVSLTFTVLSR